MKTEEMADLLDGLASMTEKLKGRSALNDIRTVSGCLRQFPGESVASFCNSIAKARTSQPVRKGSPLGTNQANVEAMVDKINHFLDNRRVYDYSQIDQLVNDFNRLNLAEIKAIGERLEGPIAPRTKRALLKAWKNWLESIKLSADQASFHLSGSSRAS